ncbi:hypothetical protein VSX64_16360 [Aurantimonas sp. C2-6-R+9]|uniref:hypothetical protein n=1 Tax=unclassified Aurantimonas TaxID=2638230 RepID=UPI002E19A6DD|nr:hypothetical protein [Aurantimonas sp. C2-6-R+9]
MLHLLLAATLVLSLTQGVTIGLGLPEAAIKAAIEAAGLLAFAWVAVFRPMAARRALVLLVPLIMLALVGFVSALGNGEGLLGGALFARQAIGPALLIACGLAVAEDRRAVRTLVLLSLAFLAVQPAVAAVKLATIGIDEKHWIGTLHQSAGQLGLLLPMVAIATVVPLALIFKPAIALFVPLFVFFGIVGEKRAIVIMLPALIVMSAVATILVARVRLGTEYAWARCGALKRIGVASVLAFSIFAAVFGGISSIPSLNPAGTAGGGFTTLFGGDRGSGIESGEPRLTPFAARYVRDYLVRDFDHEMNASRLTLEENTNIQLGRLRIIIDAFTVVARFDTPQVLFGLGGSAINQSYLLGADRSDIMFSVIGLRGPTPLALQILIEAGFVGLALTVLWFAVITVLLLSRIAATSEPIVMGLALVAIGWHASVLFDFFAYSTALWTTGTLGIPYCILIGIVLAGNGVPFRRTSRTRSASRP